MRVNYFEINKPAMETLLSLKDHSPSIAGELRALLEIRVSQINGCAFCVDMHSAEARQLGVNQQLLDCLPVWKESRLFSDSEMAALDWAESVTNISSDKTTEEKLKTLFEYFTEQEVVDLTLIVSVMNSLNRLAISFGDKPAKRNR